MAFKNLGMAFQVNITLQLPFKNKKNRKAFLVVKGISILYNFTYKNTADTINITVYLNLFTSIYY